MLNRLTPILFSLWVAAAAVITPTHSWGSAEVEAAVRADTAEEAVQLATDQVIKIFIRITVGSNLAVNSQLKGCGIGTVEDFIGITVAIHVISVAGADGARRVNDLKVSRRATGCIGQFQPGVVIGVRDRSRRFRGPAVSQHGDRL